MHVNQATDLATLNVSVGTLRFWDNGTDWMSLCPNSPEMCNWAPLDKYLAYASSNGLDVIYTFGRVPTWENPNGPNYQHLWATNVADIADWEKFVRAIVQHSNGRIKYWEVWNEPNISGFWSGSNAQLIALARSAYEIIKTEDHCSEVLLPPTSDPNWTNSYLADGGGQYADVMTFHGYPSGTPESYVPMISAFQSVFAANGYQKRPVWDTEGNWIDGDGSYTRNPDEEAAWVARSIVLQAGMGISRFVWYGWDFCNDNPCFANLWTPASGLRAPGTAYRTIAQWLQGAVIGACTNLSGTVWTCPVSRDYGYHGQIMWDTGNTTSTNNVSPAYFQYRYLLANVPLLINQHTVVLGHQPILVESRPPLGRPNPRPSPPYTQ